MTRSICTLALSAVLLVGCDKKAADAAPPEPAATAPAAKQHIDTNREGFKAAGRAAKAIEHKGEERNKSADEAMNAGK